MTRKLPIIPNVHAFANQYEAEIAKQAEHARVIEIKAWFREQALLTVQDYLGETGKDYSGILSGGARVGAIGAARAMFSDEQKSRLTDNLEKLQLTSWLDYLYSVASRREAGALLVQWDDDDSFGFIDHQANEVVRIKVSDLRASRKEIKADQELWDELEELAERLGLEDGQAALDVSRSPMTRASLLGPSPYGDQAQIATPEDSPVEGEQPAPLPSMTIDQLADLWEAELTGSFARKVPELKELGER